MRFPFAGLLDPDRIAPGAEKRAAAVGGRQVPYTAPAWTRPMNLASPARAFQRAHAPSMQVPLGWNLSGTSGAASSSVSCTV